MRVGCGVGSHVEDGRSRVFRFCLRDGMGQFMGSGKLWRQTAWSNGNQKPIFMLAVTTRASE